MVCWANFETGVCPRQLPLFAFWIFLCKIMMQEKENCGEGQAKINVNFAILRDHLEIPKTFLWFICFLHFSYFAVKRTLKWSLGLLRAYRANRNSDQKKTTKCCQSRYLPTVSKKILWFIPCLTGTSATGRVRRRRLGGRRGSFTSRGWAWPSARTPPSPPTATRGHSSSPRWGARPRTRSTFAASAKSSSFYLGQGPV